MTHTPENCDCPYTREPQRLGRANYVCPVCKRDVSFETMMLEEAKKGNVE